jgi:hypothetical protein
MTAPVRIGRIALAALVGVLAVIGLLESAAVALGLGFVLATLAGLLGYAATQHGSRAPRPTVLGCAAAGLCTPLVLAGLAALLGQVAVPVVLLGLTGTGWWYLRHDRTRGEPAAVDTGTDGAATDLTALTDVQLGRAWRSSHAGLGRARTAAELARLCAVRRRQLDEMERRNPSGFHRWIGSGSWVTGDSAPFLGGP